MVQYSRKHAGIFSNEPEAMPEVPEAVESLRALWQHWNHEYNYPVLIFGTAEDE